MVAKVAAVYAICLGIDLARRKWIESIFRHWVDQHWEEWCARGRKMKAWLEIQLENL